MKKPASTKAPPCVSDSTPVEMETTDEFQPAYERGGPVRSDEPERDWFVEEGAAAVSNKAKPAAAAAGVPDGNLDETIGKP
jgi:hypothetical protein